MYRKILVPLDGSALAESVLPQVEELARRFNTQVILLRATWAHTLPGFDEAEPQLHAVQEAEDYIAGIERQLRARGFSNVETAVWYADAATAILEHAARNGVDLIAMSSHARGGLGRLFIGSVATKVLQATSTPVLLHRPLLADGDRPVSAPYRRILVPLDGSELAETVLPGAIALAKGMGAEIVLLQVVAPYIMAEELPIAPKGVTKERLKVMEYLEEVVRHVGEHGVPANWIMRAGWPAEQIVAAAEQQAADLIAMSTHGRSTIGRIIRGSVADLVVRSVAVPVLLTRSVGISAGRPALAGRN